MQIVIDIGEDLYKSIICHRCKIEFQQKCDYEKLKKAIEDGTLIPKGHGRLIDADAFGKELHRYTEAPYQYVLKVFNDAPTIIEADKRGREV